MGRLHIRQATVDDVDALIQIGQRCATAPQWSENQYHQLFDLEQRPRMLVLVAESEDMPSKILGFLVASRALSEWELESIAVDPSSSRQGLGTRLMGELIARVAAAGGGAILLEVRASNAAARAFYETCGFEPAGLRKLYYSNPPEDALLYRHTVEPTANPLSS